jgi:hypothetical protein
VYTTYKEWEDKGRIKFKKRFFIVNNNKKNSEQKGSKIHFIWPPPPLPITPPGPDVREAWR